MAGKNNKADEQPTEGAYDGPRANGPGARATGGDPWRGQLFAIARELFDAQSVERLREHTRDFGKIGDAVLAAHLNDLRLIDKARFQRARREAGRMLATGGKQDVELAIERVRSIGSELGTLRIQRDLATGELAPPEDATARDTGTPSSDAETT